MPRVALLLPTATYRAPDYLAAARELGIEVVVVSERRQALEESMGERALVVPFDDPEAAAAEIVDHARRHPLDAVVAVDEPGLLPAALASAELGLPQNPADAVAVTRDKVAMRERLARAGVSQPGFRVAAPGDDVGEVATAVGFPCVVKATSLSASRGVLRADDGQGARDAAATIRRVLADADTGADTPPDPEGPLLVEEYVAGAEIAVEGLLVGGRLEVLAIFDKPEPMEGPTFEETLLVTPSRLPEPAQHDVRRITAEACEAIGLLEGPVHAEARVADGDVRFLEIAARSIGGLCSRTLRFGTGMSLEEVVLRHAVGMPLRGLAREQRAAGVLMLPVARRGVFEELRGAEDALAVPGIDGLELTVHRGTEVRPLPESSRYVGFVFARGDDPATVEEALRSAWDRLDIVVAESR